MDTITRNSDGFIVLKRKYSELYRRVNYLAPVQYVFNRVYEYDIRSANTSVMEWKKILPKATLDKLNGLNKGNREIRVGEMIRANKKLYKALSAGIIQAKKKLFEANMIQDADVLSIKNDAVFIIGRKLKVTKFGPVEFVLKNQFSLYHKIERVEFYYNKSLQILEAKGINDYIMEDEEQQAGILSFIKTVFDYLLLDRRTDLKQYLIQFSNDYKSRKLKYQYYKELNYDNVYRHISEIDDYSFSLTHVNQDSVDDLNIVYNYLYYVLPLIQLYM